VHAHFAQACFCRRFLARIPAVPQRLPEICQKIEEGVRGIRLKGYLLGRDTENDPKGSISDDAAKKAAKQQMGAQAELGDKGLSVLGEAAAEGSVETFALVPSRVHENPSHHPLDVSSKEIS